MRRRQRHVLARYGVLARSLDVAFVNGHLYIAPVPLAGSRDPRSAPPTAVVWLLSRVHPTFRRRNRAARRALQDRPWRSAARTWFDSERQHWCVRNAEIEAIDPTGLDDAALARHLAACRRLDMDGYRRHFELHGDDLLPIGLLIARGQEWGLDPALTTSALAAIAGRPASSVPAWMLVTGYDLDAEASIELGAPLRGRNRSPNPFPTSGRVPSADRAELEELLADARTAVELRDDNGAITGAWPMGLLRRAMLAVGARLLPDDPILAIEATVDELTALLAGAPIVDSDELEARRQTRAPNSALDAPQTLGPAFAISPLEALPGPLRRIGAAQLATAEHMFTGERPVGVGTSAYTGRALVVDDPADALATLESGDVVVTAATSPAWNIVLSSPGALVTAHGGLVSHAAVIARELGISAVIGDASVCSPTAHRRRCDRRPGPGDGRLGGRRPVTVSASPAFASSPTLVTLHALRIAGRVPDSTLSDLTGLDRSTLDDELRTAAAAGLAVHYDRLLAGWSLTDEGRRRHQELLTEERSRAGRDLELAATYESFSALNGWFKTLCTEWQMLGHPRSSVDRLSPATPKSPPSRIASLRRSPVHAVHAPLHAGIEAPPRRRGRRRHRARLRQLPRRVDAPPRRPSADGRLGQDHGRHVTVRPSRPAGW